MRIKAKFRSVSGASMVLALVIMMTVSVICVSVLKVASSAPPSAYAQQDLEQSYVFAASAAKVIKAKFDQWKNTDNLDGVTFLSVLDTETTKKFTLQLSDANVTIPATSVTLTKVFDADAGTGSVVLSLGETASGGVPVSVNIPTDVDIWRKDNDSDFLFVKLYPQGYIGAVHPPASVLARSDYAPGVYYHTYMAAQDNDFPKVRWTVIWRDEDGKQLQQSAYLEGAAEPAFQNALPTKAGDDNWWSYSFKTWLLTTAGSVKIYTASFEGAVRKYKVIWLNGDGSEITNGMTDSTTGAEPTFSGATPTKADTDYFSYTFDKWDEGTFSVNDTVKTYTPRFTETAKAYTVRWLDVDGTELETQTYYPGDNDPKPTTNKLPKPSDDDSFYEFDNPVEWEESQSGTVITCTPQYTRTLRKSVTVTWRNGDTEAEPYHTDTFKESSPGVYPDITLDYDAINALPAKTATEFVTYTFSQSGNWINDWTLESEVTVESGKQVYYTPYFTETPTCDQVIWYDTENNVLDRQHLYDNEPKPNYTPDTGYEWYLIEEISQPYLVRKYGLRLKTN